MTHQEFLRKTEEHYKEVLKEKELLPASIFTVWSCKTANNSKVILADSATNWICEATLIGSKNLIVYDFYEKFKHEEHAAI